jgi:hypothetical protein
MGKAGTVEQKRPVAEVTEVTLPTCQHHWLIDTPKGSLSQGHCKRCGEKREFRNSAQDHLWENESGSGYNAWRGIRSVTRNVSDDDTAVAGGVSAGSSMAV